MAQVSIPPSPAAMSRRQPLSNLPNMVNSSFQNLTTAAATKRQRSQSTLQRDSIHGQPPSKKQIVEVPPTMRTPVRQSQQQIESKAGRKSGVRSRLATTTGDPPPFAPGTTIAQQNQQQYQQQQQQQQQQQRKNVAKAPLGDQTHQSLETVFAWQRHYRKAFPSYVFYFESIPDDVGVRFMRQVLHLGAKIEKFFSAEVTHVITTRSIPPDTSLQTSATSSFSKLQPATINPSLLEKPLNTNAKVLSRKYSNTSRVIHEDGDAKKVVRGSSDILMKAREYGMKIWALEKLNRMMSAMFEINTSQVIQNPTQNRGTVHTQNTSHVAPPNVDLSQLLRNERLHGPTDRDPNAVSKDLVYFKGPYVFVRDMMAINRPIMVRDYPKVKSREDGAWPQFRSVSGGKCPFVDEAGHRRREKERERQLEKQDKREKDMVEISKWRATKMQPPAEKSLGKRALAEIGTADNRANYPRANGITAAANKPAAKTATGTRQTSAVPVKRGNNSSFVSGGNAFTSTNQENSQYSRYNEPNASGVQPSNITSAIRSQVVSSHIDQPGQRAGTSKELYELKRKVAGNVLMGNTVGRGIPHSRRMMDLAGAAAGKYDTKTAGDHKRKYGEEVVQQNANPNEGGRGRIEGRKIATPKKNVVKKEARPGYCENCREKFNDFEEHTFSRLHRRFALNNSNWNELDDLLKLLARTPKGHSSKAP